MAKEPATDPLLTALAKVRQVGLFQRQPILDWQPAPQSFSHIGLIVHTATASYFAKVLDVSRDTPGRNMRDAFTLQQYCAQLALSPTPLVYDQQLQVMVFRYLPHDENWQWHDALIDQFALKLAQFHQLQPKAHHHQLQQLWQSYASIGDGNEARVAKVLADFPRYTGFCHNDLTTGNILHANAQLYLVDLEYAAFSERGFDITVLFADHHFSARQQQQFIQTYNQQWSTELQLPALNQDYWLQCAVAYHALSYRWYLSRALMAEAIQHQQQLIQALAGLQAT